MKQALFVIAALTSAFGTADAKAQATAQPAPPSEIIVEEERPQSEVPLTDLAREMAGNPRWKRPLARFEQPLCLMVAATDMTLGKEIAERIIDNAKMAKIRVGSPNCKPNALLNVTEDAHGQLLAIRKSRRRLFAGLRSSELDKALAVRDPVYVLQASMEVAANGQPFVTDPGAPANATMNGTTNVVWSAGRLKRETREDMLAALVVIDAKAVAGLSPVQIADYASLRLLAPTGEVDAKEAGAPRTIMTLFVAPDSAPPGMTRFDRAYLKALYGMMPGSFSNDVLRAAVLEAARGITNEDE